MQESAARKQSSPPLPIAPRPTLRGARLYAFTRHPRALRRVQDLVTRASDRELLSVMLRFAESGGASGRVTMGVDELANQAVRSARRRGVHDDVTYSVHTANVSLRNLRAMGLVSWDRVMPLGRFPSGKQTRWGGRVFWLNIPALRGEGPPWVPGTRTPATPDAIAAAAAAKARAGAPEHAPRLEGACARRRELAALARAARQSEQAIVHDQGGMIADDHSSDPLVLPEGEKSRIGAERSPASAALRAAGDDGRANARPGPRAPEPAAQPPTPTPPSPASSRSLVTTSGTPPRQTASRPDETRAPGEREQRASQRRSDGPPTSNGHQSRTASAARSSTPPRSPTQLVAGPATPLEHVRDCMAKLSRVLGPSAGSRDDDRGRGGTS